MHVDHWYIREIRAFPFFDDSGFTDDGCFLTSGSKVGPANGDQADRL